uniref:protein-serine/threonine phosphatase n=1 Tax=Cucumis melo TaxID=3656 RepID=A0A9I9DJD3_CUCME
MALLSPRLHRFRLTKLHHVSASKPTKTTKLTLRKKARCCSAIAIDAPSSLTGAAGIRWGSTTLQGLREEMEDDAVVWSDGFNDFLFAAVFDGHGGYSSVKFLREELYKDCVAALQGGLLLNGGDFEVIKAALEKAFDDTDKRLLLLLEAAGEEDESGATATVAFIRNDVLFISHLDSSKGEGVLPTVLSRSGGAQVLTSSHRPYGNNSTSLQEIRRIREAGGWFNGDLVTASPEIFQVTLGSNAEFVLMASDGLWDYMNSSDAVGFVRNELRQHGDVQLACEALAQAALDKGSQDNISIIMADLGRTDWQNLPLQQDNVIFELAQAFATIGLVSLGIWWASSSFSL